MNFIDTVTKELFRFLYQHIGFFFKAGIAYTLCVGWPDFIELNFAFIASVYIKLYH